MLRGPVLGFAAIIAVGACDPAPTSSPTPAATQATPLSPDAVAMEAMAALADLSTTAIEVQFDRGAPVAVRGTVKVAGSTPTEKALDYFRQTRSLYGLDGPQVGLVARQAGQTRAGGPEFATFSQTHRGIPVLGAEISVVSRGDTVLGTGGPLRTGLHVSTTAAITSSEALDAARAFAADATTSGHPALAILDPSLLGGAGRIGPPTDQPSLVWQVRVNRPEGPSELLVDATTGAVLRERSLHQDDHERDISVTSFRNQTWSGAETYCGLLVATRDESDIETGFAARYFDETRHWYLDNLGVNSWDNLGAPIVVRIDTLMLKDGEPSPNARWATGCNVFEFSDGWVHSGTQQYSGVVAHEFQHAVTDAVGGGLYYEWMSGALNESYSDVFAMFVIDDDFIPAGLGGRSLSDPNSQGDPDRWSERFSATNPCGPVVADPCDGDPDFPDRGWLHSNSSIGNHLGYLLRTGGTHADTGIAVAPIELSRLPQMYLDALILMPSVSDYWTFRWAFQQVAAGNPADLCSVHNAFGAVELGAADQDCDGILDPMEDEDFDTIVASEDNCPTTANPTQVDFDDDGKGDPCDEDRDGDGVAQGGVREMGDNCPDLPNTDQADGNRNGIGTACDTTEDGDADDDAVADGVDNCPDDFNAKPQPDADRDGDGDACDADLDGDGIANPVDNCLSMANGDQADGDRDGIGNACDSCPTTADAGTHNATVAYLMRTGELVLDEAATAADSDGDGLFDSCDRDVAGDGAAIRFESTVAGLRSPDSEDPRTGLTVTGSDGGQVNLVIALCALVCTEAPAPDACVEARVTDADSSTRVAVVDDDGDTVARSAGEADSSLRWSPDGATTYELVFQLLGGFTDDDLSVEIGRCSAGGPGPGASPGPSVSAPPVPLPSFTAGSATVQYSLATASQSLSGGRCGVAVINGYAFSVSAGVFGGGDFIAVTAMQVSLPLNASWAATITGTLGETTFATFEGVLTIHADGASGEFSGETAAGELVSGSFTC